MRTVPLKYLVRINSRALPENTDPSHEFGYIDISMVGRGRLLGEPQALSFAEAPSRARRLVSDGDTIVSTVRTYLRAVWPVKDMTDELVVSTGFAVLTPGSGVDPRFLTWLVQSDLVIEDVVARSVGVSYPGINASEIGDVRVPVPTIEVQREIANYLDSETARIDALTHKKSQLSRLVRARESAVVEQTIRGLDAVYGSLPLKYVAPQIQVGIVVTPAAWYADAGVLALRGLNIRPGEIVLDDAVTISPEGHRLHRNSELKAGDIVVVRTGQAGAAAVVPGALTGSNCIDLVIVRSDPRIVPRYLEFVLNSDWTQKHVQKFSVGTIQSHFNVGAMKQVPVPIPPTEEQLRVVLELATEVESLRRVSGLLDEQVGKLGEYRQALITAAVTGERDLPGRAA